LAGWVAERRRPVIANDVRKDRRWSEKADARAGFKTRQVVAVPLLFQGRLLGVVEGINKKGAPGFSPDDQRALEILSGPIAAAVKNAQLFAEVKGEKERWEALFAQMAEGAILFDDNGKIMLINAAAQGFFETDGDPRGRPLAALLDNFDATPPLAEVLASPGSSVAMNLSRRVGKAFHLAGTLSRFSPNLWLLILRDITEGRKEEIIKRNFLSLISHKLKTPLVSILGYVPLLLEKGALSEFQKKALLTIRDQSQKLSQLVDKLLSFATVESDALTMTRAPLAPSEIIAEGLLPLAAFFQSRKAEVVRDEGLNDLPPVLGQKQRLGELVRSLVENAVKFNDKPRKTVRISGSAGPRMVEFTIADNGPGIPREEEGRLFQKFYQIEENFTGQVEGAGLGLALCRQIVESHGGVLRIRSRLKEGTSVTFTLPRSGPS
jgi:signal transduction histidine kinase